MGKDEVDGYSSPLLDSLAESPEDDGRRVDTKTISRPMIGATTGMVALTVALTVFAGPLFGSGHARGGEHRGPGQLHHAVFPDGTEHLK